MSFTIGGHSVTLTKDGVVAALRGVDPGAVKKYRVRIGDQDYPIKQAVSVAANVPTAAFISTDAYRILTRLGFEVRG